MGLKFTSLAKKIVVALTIVAFLVIVPTFATESPKPTITFSHYNSDSHTNNVNLSSFSWPSKFLFGKYCHKLLKEEIVAKVLEHTKAPQAVKIVLEKSAKFGICVADHICHCFRLRLEPLVFGCFGVVGALCMKQVAISDPSYHCALNCAKSLMNRTNTLDDDAIGALCYRKCVKSN